MQYLPVGRVVPDHIRRLYQEEQQKLYAAKVAQAKAAAKYTPGLANRGVIMDGRADAAAGVLPPKGKGQKATFFVSMRMTDHRLLTSVEHVCPAPRRGP